jgi:hypothetical protein
MTNPSLRPILSEIHTHTFCVWETGCIISYEGFYQFKPPDIIDDWTSAMAHALFCESRPTFVFTSADHRMGLG